MRTDWGPSANFHTLQVRATILSRLRTFFAQRGVMEVETPILSHAGSTDPKLHSFITRFVGPGAARGATLYLHTSPEFAMKRLLAAGSGSIYQLTKAFRNGEAGAKHNPEFTLLEWYRVGFDHFQLMDEVASLIHDALTGCTTLATPERITYQEAFLRYVDLDPHAAALPDLRARAHALGITLDLGDDRDAWLDLLLTHAIEPHLGIGRVTLLYDYPASQAALARIRPGTPATAERFEAYVNGLELANGYHELGDAAEQRARFAHDLARRANEGLPAGTMDDNLLAALEAGLPDCAGVALGVDRLVMLAAGTQSISDVITFPVDRA